MTLEPPDYIDEDAKAEFRKLNVLLASRAKPTDVYVMAEFAQCISDIKMLTDVVRIEGKTTTSDAGATKMNPNLNVLLTRRATLSRLMGELGLTPRSRKEKLTVNDDEKKGLRDLL